jgi:hypothetical protein
MPAVRDACAQEQTAAAVAVFGLLRCPACGLDSPDLTGLKHNNTTCCLLPQQAAAA